MSPPNVQQHQRTNSAPAMTARSHRMSSPSTGSAGSSSWSTGALLQLLLAVLLFAAVLLVWQATAAHACITIVVGDKATNDGSLIVTHNNDCEDCDVRIGVVPAEKHKKGSECPVYPGGFDFPRFVGADRGSLYTREHLALEGLPDWPIPNNTKPLGFIPQVSHTYQYFDGSYGMMNEHGVAIGESTCGAKVAAYSRARGGKALWEASTLSRVALQRCKTAQCAVELMGYLAEKDGFTGSEDPPEEGVGMFDVAGEALTVIDGREAWVLHVLADASGSSAIWAAQRVPPDHVAVVPNQFVIDRINVSDRHNFRSSKDIVGQAIAAKLIDARTAEEEGGADNFHFSRTFALDFDETVKGVNGGEGERRRWRIFSLLAPSLGLQPDAGRFPFSVRVDPDRRPGVRDVMALMRDHYEGTAFDQTSGLAAGPYGNPNRYDRTKALAESTQGYFERSVSIHRTSYSFVAHTKAANYSRKHDDDEQQTPEVSVGTLWLAHHSPATSLYLPLSARSSALPDSFGRGSLYKLDRASAWWAFASVANSAERMWGPIHEHITLWQERMEQHSSEQMHIIHSKTQQLMQMGNHKAAVQLATEFTSVDAWWHLLDELTVTFRDGVVLKSSHPPLHQKHVFYPLWWLKAVGYFEKGALAKPIYPPAPQAPMLPAVTTTHAQMSKHTHTEMVLVEEHSEDSTAANSSGLQEDDEQPGSLHPKEHWWHFLQEPTLHIPVALTLLVVCLLIMGCLCFYCGRWWARRREYEPITDQEAEALAAMERRRYGVNINPRVRLTNR